MVQRVCDEKKEVNPALCCVLRPYQAHGLLILLDP